MVSRFRKTHVIALQISEVQNLFVSPRIWNVSYNLSDGWIISQNSIQYSWEELYVQRTFASCET